MGHSQFTIRAALLLSLGALAGAGYLLKPELIQTMTYLLLHGDVVGTIDFIKSYGPYAMVVSFFIIVFINIVAVLPNCVFCGG